MSDLFMRDDHLSDLSLERILAGELKDDHALRHVQTCTVCKARFEALQSHEHSFKPAAQPAFGGLIIPTCRWIAPLCRVCRSRPVFWRFSPTQSRIIDFTTAPRPLDGPDTFRIKGSVNVEFSVKRGYRSSASHG